MMNLYWSLIQIWDKISCVNLLPQDVVDYGLAANPLYDPMARDDEVSVFCLSWPGYSWICLYSSTTEPTQGEQSDG